MMVSFLELTCRRFAMSGRRSSLQIPDNISAGNRRSPRADIDSEDTSTYVLIVYESGLLNYIKFGLMQQAFFGHDLWHSVLEL